jgi:hypothetical protein
MTTKRTTPASKTSTAARNVRARVSSPPVDVKVKEEPSPSPSRVHVSSPPVDVKEERKDDDEDSDLEPLVNVNVQGLHVDDETPLCNLAEVEIANIPVLSSVKEILKEAIEPTLLRVYLDLKVVYIRKGIDVGNGKNMVDIYCCSIKRKETAQSIAKLKRILDASMTEMKAMVMKNMVRLTVWNSSITEVQRKIGLLDIIRVRKYTRLHVFNGTAQMNVNLPGIEVGRV